MKKNVCVLFLFVFCKSIAQNGLGSWNILNVTMKINQKWSVFTEGQIRSLSFYDDFHYYEIKVGATYKIKPNFSVTTGIGDYNTYSEGGNFEKPMQNNEKTLQKQTNIKQTTMKTHETQ